MAEAAGKSKRMQPAWQPPKGDGTVTLKLYNSLTRKKMYENVIAFYYLKELGLVPDTIICQEECKMENKLV